MCDMWSHTFTTVFHKARVWLHSSDRWKCFTKHRILHLLIPNVDIMGSHVARDITMPRTVRMVCLWFKSIWNVKLKRSIPQEIFQSFWNLRENVEGLSFDAESDLWISIKCMENIIMDKSSMIKGDDDDHEYYYCHYYYHHHHYHHHHPHQNHYLHISSIGYLYVILTLHLNQNHLGTSGPNLVSLRKDHLSDRLMKDFIL